MKFDIWQTAESLNKEYVSLNLDAVIDYEKYKLYSIVTSSTQLEGSTLNELDTKLLLDDGITAKGKPLEHHLMVRDNYEAMKFAMQAGDVKSQLSVDLLKKLNSLNMAATGAIVSNALGTVDGRQGTFRLVNAFSEALGYYLDARKIPEAVHAFCNEFNRQMETGNPMQVLKSSFDAHANLVLIHPWQDGNKRTSRLVMNFMQRRAGVPLTKVHKEDSREYLLALKAAKDNGDLAPFRNFMIKQHVKTLQHEMTEYKQINKKNRGFSLIL
jgi:Fic family protein